MNSIVPTLPAWIANCVATERACVAFADRLPVQVETAEQVLEACGAETARYAGPAPGLQWANPANIAFDGHGALLVTNHASLTGLPDPSPLFAISTCSWMIRRGSYSRSLNTNRARLDRVSRRRRLC